MELKLTIPVDEPYAGALLFLKQSDTNSRVLRVALSNGGRPIRAEEWSEGITRVALAVRRADGERKAFEGSYEEDGDVFLFTVPYWATAVKGNVAFEVQVYYTKDGEEACLRSSLFRGAVQGSAYDGTDISEEDEDLLTGLIAEAEAAVAAVSAQHEECEAVIEAAENAAQSAAQAAETATEAAEKVSELNLLTNVLSDYETCAADDLEGKSLSVLVLGEDETYAVSVDDLLAKVQDVLVTADLDEDAKDGLIQFVILDEEEE